MIEYTSNEENNTTNIKCILLVFLTFVTSALLAGPKISTVGGFGLSTTNVHGFPTDTLSKVSIAKILAAGETAHLNGLPGTS